MKIDRAKAANKCAILAAAGRWQNERIGENIENHYSAAINHLINWNVSSQAIPLISDQFYFMAMRPHPVKSYDFFYQFIANK